MPRKIRWVVVGIVALFWLAPRPADAGCYKCVYQWFCMGFSCYGTWDCGDQGVGCSSCYNGCMEGFDTCEEIGGFCEWARLSPSGQLEAPKLEKAAFLAALRASALESRN